MGMVNYLENTGITLSQRAFFSYTAKPQGSYGLHMIFRQFLKKKRIVMRDSDHEGWCRFLADYALFRLYIARFLLKDYARDYPPLLSIYAGFDRVNRNFPRFLQKEADPGRGVGDISLLPDRMETFYSEEKTESLMNLFNTMEEKAEHSEANPHAVLKSLITQGLSFLSSRNKVPLYTPVFWFFSRETLDYARYLSDFYKGLIPESFYEDITVRPYEESERREDDFYTDYRLLAYIFFFVAGLICLILTLAYG